MGKRLAKITALVLMGLLLSTLPGLAGCAEEKAGVRTISIGFIGDFTGPTSLAFNQMLKSVQDYFDKAREENILPAGVEAKLMIYDTKAEYSRAPAGYLWARGRGAQMMYVGSSELPMITSRLEADGVPAYSGTLPSLDLIQGHWWVSRTPSAHPEIEGCMMWVLENWDYDSLGVPKIGLIGMAGVPWSLYQMEAAQDFIESNPGKFEWVAGELPPRGTMAYASEIQKLKDCDFIITAAAGPQLAAFIKEARTRGYDGGFISAMGGTMAFWELVRAAVPPEQLTGMLVGYSVLWWTDTAPYVTECRETAQERHSPAEAEELMNSMAYISSWIDGMIFVDVIKRAVEKVGVDNIDSLALRDALFETNMTVEGFPYPWSVSEDMALFLKAIRVYEYSQSEDTFFPITGWLVPPSLSGG